MKQVQTQICKACKEEKIIHDFIRSKAKIETYDKMCKKCRKASRNPSENEALSKKLPASGLRTFPYKRSR